MPATTTAASTSLAALARPRPSFPSRCLTPHVTEAFFKLLPRRRRPPVSALRDAKTALDVAEGRLASYRDNARLRSILRDDAFVAGVLVRHERVCGARLALADARAPVATHDLPPVPELRKRAVGSTRAICQQTPPLSRESTDLVTVARPEVRAAPRTVVDAHLHGAQTGWLTVEQGLTGQRRPLRSDSGGSSGGAPAQVVC